MLTVFYLAASNMNKFSGKKNYKSSLSKMTSPNNFSIVLSSQNSSGQNGIATLEASKNQTVIKIKVLGYAPGIPQPAHVHSGTCEKPGEIKYPLADILDGGSKTVLDVSINKLDKSDLVLNVHKSDEEINTYVSCGQIKTN